MSSHVLRSMAVICLVLFLLSGTPQAQAAPHTGPHSASSPYELINAVNALRASYGLAPYSINPILMATAQAQADYMAATGDVSHTGPGGSTVTERLLGAGYPLAGDLSLGGFRSENITSGNESKTAQDAVNGWTRDAPHLTTMISPSMTEIGAGVSINGGRVYYVIDCALPTTDGVPQPLAGTAITTVSTTIPGGGVIVTVILATPNADGDVVHEVKAGQTLWQIAISYETKIDDIKRLNNLYNNDIYPGEKLLIRKAAPVPTSTPAITATIAATITPTNLPAITVTPAIATPTSAAAVTQMSIQTSRVMSVAIGIITLALLSGIFFIGMSESRQAKIKTKE